MSKKFKKFIKYFFRYPLEFLGTAFVYLYCRMLPIRYSSAITGWLVSKIGPISGAHKTGHKNLEFAMPSLSFEEREKILQGVWDNFGRVMGEYPNLYSIDIRNDPRIEIVGSEILEELKRDNKPAIFAAAHLASWEIAIMAAASFGLQVTQLYRATNNPYVNKIVMAVQRQIGKEVLNKGRRDAKKILAVLNRGDNILILIDQKMNEGIPVPFFGKDAMTADATARLAIRYQCPLIPTRVERLGGFKFKVTFYPPVELPANEGIDGAGPYDVMLRINRLLEDWIRERPEQWLWVHRRWPR